MTSEKKKVIKSDQLHGQLSLQLSQLTTVNCQALFTAVPGGLSVTVWFDTGVEIRVADLLQCVQINQRLIFNQPSI